MTGNTRENPDVMDNRPPPSPTPAPPSPLSGHPLVTALESGRSATAVLTRLAQAREVRLDLLAGGEGGLTTPAIFAALGNPDTMTPYHRVGFLRAVGGPHGGRVLAHVTATVLLHRLPATVAEEVREAVTPLGTLLAPLGVWRHCWGVRSLAVPTPRGDTPALAASATLFLGAVPVAYVTEEVPGWVAHLPAPDSPGSSSEVRS